MTYWDIQTKLVLELDELGFKYKLRDRIPVFKVYLKLQQMAKRNPKLEEKIVELLDLLEYQLALRQAGLEPELGTNGRYKGSV